MALVADSPETGIYGPEAIQTLPEELLPTEYGRHEIAPVVLGKLIRVSQVRLGLNPEIQGLRESISQTGLINPIDVARLKEEPLQAYIDFANRLWGTNHSLDDYSPDQDGFYYLVIAGHSRVEAITQIEQEKHKEAKKLGFTTDPSEAEILCKVHAVQTPEDILAIQINENIYKEPAEERRAVAVVEMYHYGRELGKWESARGFIDHPDIKGKFSRKTVERALLFQQLPEETRSLVMQGRYKYGVAIEIARMRRPYIEYECGFYHGNDPDAIAEHMEEIIEKTNITLADLLDKAKRGKWTIKKTRDVVSGHIKACGDRLEAEETEQEQRLIMSDPSAEFRATLKIKRRRLADLMKQITNDQIHAVGEALAVHKSITTDPDTIVDIEKDAKQTLGAIGAQLVDKVVANPNGSGSSEEIEPPAGLF